MFLGGGGGSEVEAGHVTISSRKNLAAILRVAKSRGRIIEGTLRRTILLLLWSLPPHTNNPPCKN